MDTALIVSCSQRKKPGVGPAIEVYDGQLFRILRKYLPRVDLLVLSARYGLIEATQEIESYDLKLARSDQSFMMKIAGQFDELIAPHNYREVYLCMGKVYVANMLYCDVDLERRIPKQDAPIGVMQRALKKFCLDSQNGPVPHWQIH